MKNEVVQSLVVKRKCIAVRRNIHFAQIFAQVMPVYSNEFIKDESEDDSSSDD